MITINNLSKSFLLKQKKNQEFLAVSNVSFVANEGEIIGILGPNGAGKTTLLRMIAGIMQSTSGEILYDDLNFKDNEIDIKKQLAFLSGNTNLYKTLTPYELFNMCANFYKVDKNTYDKRLQEIINILNINEFLHKRIGKLSTGQLQRVNIARCLIHNPKYYILDEATNGLDIISSQIILNFIKQEKKKGKCILYSTHYMEEAENICDRIIMINKGQILYQGTPQDLKKKTKTNNLRNAFFALIEGEKDE